MSRLDQLLARYQAHVQLPWQRTLHTAQRVWFVVYDEDDERRLRVRLDKFQLATQQAGRSWRQVDITASFATWLAGFRYRDHFFNNPELLKTHALNEFRDSIATLISAELQQADPDTVVALTGISALFGIVRVAEVVQRVQPSIAGRLVVFFPGAYRNNVYRFLDRRDGWDYLALPLTTS